MPTSIISALSIYAKNVHFQVVFRLLRSHRHLAQHENHGLYHIIAGCCVLFFVEHEATNPTSHATSRPRSIISR